MSMMTLSNRNNNFHRFVTTYFEQGFAHLSLAELFHDLQPNENIGHLETMMKAVYFQNNDAIQKPTFFFQCTQASILKERSFHTKEVEERVLNFFREEHCFSDEEYPFIEEMVQSLHETSHINILEFMGYRKTKKERVPVLLAVCVFGMTKSSGCCIFYLAVSACNFSQAKFGSTCKLPSHTDGFRKLNIGSLLVCLVQAISFENSKTILIGTRTSTTIYGGFWTKLKFGCTIDPKIWPSSMFNILNQYTFKPEQFLTDKVLCICTSVLNRPVQLLVGDVKYYEGMAHEALNVVALTQHSLLTTEHPVCSPFHDHINQITSPSHSICNDADDNVTAADENFIQHMLNDNYGKDDELLSDAILGSDEPITDMNCNEDKEQCFILEDTAALSLEDDFQFTIDDVQTELNAVSTNEESNVQHQQQDNNIETAIGALHVAAASKVDMINQRKKNRKDNQMKKKRYKKVHDTSSLMLKSSTLRHSAITDDLNDSDDEYYMDEEKWERYKDNMDKINPLINRDDKDAFTNNFFQFLSGWSHLKYLKNSVFQKRRYTGYIGVGRDKFGKLIEFAFDDLYIENMCGLTQAFLINTVKASAGCLIELSKDFRDHEKEYASCWRGKQQYDTYLKLLEHHWTHLRFFKDPNNDARNRFQLRNEYEGTFMDWVPRLWFFECLSPEGETFKTLAKKLIKDCKRERENKWIKIPPGNSYSKYLPSNNSKDVFRIRVKQPISEPSCIFSSLANGFYFIGDEKAGQLLEHHAKYSLQIVDRMKYAIELTRNKDFRYNPVRYRPECFNIFNNDSEWPTVCILLGNDYSDNHAVTVVKDWILDSNAEYAMKVTQENLNWSVSSPSQSVIFLRVVEAVCFMQHKVSRKLKEPKH